MKKKLLVVFALTVGVLMTSMTTVKAEQTNVKGNVYEKTDKYDMLDSKGKLNLSGTSLIEQQMKEISEKKGRQPDIANDAYFKITTEYKNREDKILNKNGVVKSIDKFSEYEYLIEKDKKDFKIATYSALEDPLHNTTENSWIRITNNAYKRDSKSYEVYGFFEWLKTPLFKMKDVISFSTNANGSMNHSRSYAHVEYLYADPSSEPIVDYDYEPSNNYEKFQSSMNGFAYIFNLLDHATASVRGYVYGVHEKVNSTVNKVPYTFSYGHSQWNFSVSPSIAFEEASISISPAAAYDKIELTLTLPY